MEIWNRIKRNPLVLAIALVVLSQVGAFFLRSRSESTGIKLLAPLTVVGDLQSNFSDPVYCIDSVKTAKIKKLNEIILKQKEQHKLTFLELYQYHFASITLLTVFSILTGILAFLVGQKGWKDTPVITRVMFLTCGALTSFYGLSIKIYQQDIGIKKNINSYIQYDNIQKEILNYCSTNPNQTVKGDSLEFSEFHTYIVGKIIETNNIFLEFDKDAIEVKDYFDQK